MHGGPTIVKAVLAAIPQCAADTGDDSQRASWRLPVRYAEAGEFTKQAFHNQRLSLPQIEALGDTLAADTEQQRLAALRGSDKRITRVYDAWRDLLLQARGQTEAYLDFSEDQHLEGSEQDFIKVIAEQVTNLSKQLATHLRNAVKGELLRSGIKVALLGPPNAGKSSLLNRVIGREAAIVSEQAGTTRDIVDVSVDIGGYLTLFGDTAGLRSEDALAGEMAIGAVELEGMRRARQRALESDVVIVMLAFQAIQDPSSALGPMIAGEEVLDAAAKCARAGKEVVVALNKSDLLSTRRRHPTDEDDVQSNRYVSWLKQAWQTRMPGHSIDPIPISCTTSSGADPGDIQRFLGRLIQAFKRLTDPEGTRGDLDSTDPSSLLPTSQPDSLGATHRQRLLLEECQSHLDAFLGAVGSVGNATPETEEGVDLVIAAESLRAAAECLARITGKGIAGDVEEVLGVVFEKFCVGK